MTNNDVVKTFISFTQRTFFFFTFSAVEALYLFHPTPPFARLGTCPPSTPHLHGPVNPVKIVTEWDEKKSGYKVQFPQQWRFNKSLQFEKRLYPKKL